MEIRVLWARALYLGGSVEEASQRAQEVLRSRPDDISMHLLICG
jgi:hypothetical protein